jgi:hypothetical protein
MRRTRETGGENARKFAARPLAMLLPVAVNGVDMMKSSRVVAVAVALAVTAVATPSFAQRAQGRSRGPGGVVGRAVPRGSVRPLPGPRGGRVIVNRGYRGGWPVYGYNAWGWGAPYGFYGSGIYGGFYYGNGWGGWGSPYWGWGPRVAAAPLWYGSAYGYGYPGAATPSYVAAVPGRLDGGVRLDVAERDAQVFVDGYYVGVVGDFNGVRERITLEPGPHRVEIQQDGFEPVSFDVNVEAGRTITYRTQLRPLNP